MAIYACGNELCYDLVLRVFEGLPTKEPAESRVFYAHQGLVEEEGMSSTVCEPYEGGGLRVKVEGISSSESLSSL